MKSHKYELVNNKEWLVQRYIDEKLSVFQIGKLIGCKSSNTIRQALFQFGIGIRDQSEAQRLKQTIQPILNESVITGCLLGDGNLTKYNKHNKKSCPHFNKGNIHHEHVVYVAKSFYEDGDQRVTRQSWLDNDIERVVYHFSTSAVPELQPYFEKWYPGSNNFKKVIPKDIVLDKISLLHWFLDDGTSYLTPKGYLNIAFCTDCFYLNDIEMLCNQLNEKFKLTARIGSCNKNKWTKDKKYYRIYLADGTARDFLDIIGSSPIKCFEYKWKNHEPRTRTR